MRVYVRYPKVCYFNITIYNWILKILTISFGMDFIDFYSPMIFRTLTEHSYSRYYFVQINIPSWTLYKDMKMISIALKSKLRFSINIYCREGR